MAPMRYICTLFATQTPTLLPCPIICTSINLMLIITPLKLNARTLSEPIPRLATSVGTGWNETADYIFYFYAWTGASTILPSLYSKYADMFEKETTKLLSRRVYIWIDVMLTMPLTLRTTGRPNRHYFENEKWLFVVSSQNCYHNHWGHIH